MKKIDSLLKKFDNVQMHSIVIGGDWNFILDKKLDATGGNPVLKLNSIAEFTKLKNKFDLLDIFRIRNLERKRFTFTQQTPRLARRLDYFLISGLLQDRIKKCDILSSLSSDHSPILIKINGQSTELKKGSNYWKFNNSLLKNLIFCACLKKLIEEKKIEYMNFDAQSKWELIKFEIRKLTIDFSKKIAKEKREKKALHEERVISYETTGEQHGVTEEQYRISKNELEKLYNELTEGYILRSKCNWYEEGEKSSKFFLGLEKKKATQGTILTLVKNTSTVIDNQRDILDEIRDFYKKLFSRKSHETVQSCDSFLEIQDLPKISTEDKVSCETEISIDDLKYSLLSMEDKKSPGNDGLTKEFYVIFWEDVSEVMYNSLMLSKQKGELSSSQKQAVIKLIEKKDRDKRFLKNWRPISLLNIDVKLLNKSLAYKLKKTLPSIIKSDQTAYVPGRFIGESARQISDILEVTKTFNIPGYMITMDIEKAFDSMDHVFLLKVIEKFGFGKKFIDWIRIIIKNQESCVMNGGNSTGYFILERGARQGDPISAYLFIMVLEVFFHMIRTNRDINGIKIFDHIFQISAYADDTTFFCADSTSVKLIKETFDNYSKYSGLLLNASKCEICGIGVKRGVEVALCGMKSVNLLEDSIKILGIHYSYNSGILK